MVSQTSTIIFLRISLNMSIVILLAVHIITLDARHVQYCEYVFERTGGLLCYFPGKVETTYFVSNVKTNIVSRLSAKGGVSNLCKKSSMG